MGLGVLGFFGVTGAALFGIGLDKPDPPSPSPTVTAAPSPTKTGRTVTAGPTAPTREPDNPGGALAGEWSGNSQLSAYESTSLAMTLSLGDDGRYTWVRDVVHDSGFWEVEGDAIAFEQDGGGQYAWPFQLSGSGDRQILRLVTSQGGITKLRRTR